MGSFGPLLTSTFYTLVNTIKKCSHGIGTPNLSKMKGWHLTLTERWLYKNGFHDKLLKAPEMVLSKFDKEFFWHQIPPLHCTKIEGSDHFNIVKRQKWAKYLYQTMNFWETLRISLSGMSKLGVFSFIDTIEIWRESDASLTPLHFFITRTWTLV